MKRGHVYTLVFLTVITAVFVFALAAAYEGFKPAINGNKVLQEQRAVLYALGLGTGLKDSGIAAAYTEKIRPAALNGLAEVGGVPVLGHYENGALLAYAVPFEGNALWGALRGYLGVRADLGSLTGIVFTYQNETPGLGGRIDEDWYKEQFRGLPVAPGAALAYGAQDGYAIDAVTGATSTSAAVLRTVNKALRESVFPGEVK